MQIGYWMETDPIAACRQNINILGAKIINNLPGGFWDVKRFFEILKLQTGCLVHKRYRRRSESGDILFEAMRCTQSTVPTRCFGALEIGNGYAQSCTDSSDLVDDFHRHIDSVLHLPPVVFGFHFAGQENFIGPHSLL